MIQTISNALLSICVANHLVNQSSLFMRRDLFTSPDHLLLHCKQGHVIRESGNQNISFWDGLIDFLRYTNSDSDTIYLETLQQKTHWNRYIKQKSKQKALCIWELHNELSINAIVSDVNVMPSSWLDNFNLSNGPLI